MRFSLTDAKICFQVAAATSLLALPVPADVKEINAFENLDFPTLVIARDTVQSALERRAAGESEVWRVSGIAAGSVTPLRTWKSKSGHWCREYEELIELADGQTQRNIATRCRTPDGHWLEVKG